MIVILEGNELNFKSTVAEKLKEEMKCEAIKGNSFELAQLPEGALVTYLYGITKKHAAIVDRFIYSNLVYTNLYEGYTRLQEDQVEFLEKVLKGHALVVHLHAKADTLIKRKQHREEKDVDDAMFSKINDEFSRVLKDSRLPVLEISTEEYSSTEITEIIMKYVRGTIN